MYNLLFWVSIQLLLLWALNWATRTYRNRKLFKLAISPALIIDSQLRLGWCCITGRSVKEVAFFEDRKPFLKEGPPKTIYLGHITYIVLWQVCAFYLFHQLATGMSQFDSMAMALPHVDPVEMSEGVFAVDAREYLEGLQVFWQSLSWDQWPLWAFLYLMGAFYPCLSIDFHQFKWGALFVGAIALFTACFIFLGIKPGFLSRGWWLNWWILPDFFKVYSLYISGLVVAVVAHVTVRMSWLALCRQARKSAKKIAQSDSSKKKRETQPTT